MAKRSNRGPGKSNSMKSTATLSTALLSIFTAGIVPTAYAATWNNTGTDYNSAGSWTGGVPTGAVADFTAVAVNSPNLSASVSSSQLRFTGAGSGYTLGGNAGTALTLTGTGTGTGFTPIQMAGTGTNTINANLVLAAVAGTQYADVSSGALVVNGNISGPARLYKNGGGTITLAGSNSYAGGFTLNNGTVNVNSATAFGTGQVLVGANFGTNALDNTSGAALTISTGNAITFNASASTVAFMGSNNLNLGTGTVTLTSGSTRTFNTLAKRLTLGGTVGQSVPATAATLQKLGIGTLELSAASSYTGSTQLRGGVLLLRDAAALGSGPLLIQADTTAVTGSPGILGLGAGDFLRPLGSGAGQVSISGGGGFSATGGFAAYGADRVVNIGGAAATLIFNQTTDFSTGTLVLGSGDSDGTLEFRNPLNLTSAGGGQNRTLLTNDGSAVVDGWLSGVVSGTNTASTFAKTGAGTLRLSNANTFTGVTTISAGRLLLTNGDGTSGTGTGNITLNGGATAVLSGTGGAFGRATVTNASHIAPGNLVSNTSSLGSAGALRIGVGGTIGAANATTGLVLTSAALDFDLAALVAGTSDQIVTAGTLTLGDVAFTFNALNGLLQPDVAYTLISGASTVGGFNAAALAGATTFTGGLESVYAPTYSLSGNTLQVTFSSLAPAVPEPASGGLVALAATALLGRRSRRNA